LLRYIGHCRAHGDHVGYLLFQALWQAAERGVRVRLLLDDLNTTGLDSTIAALDAHSNIEVRLYNPVVIRDNRVLNFVTDFTRVNRRMHNKSFTADNQATVVGGRNIADEYFGAGAGLTFADLDVVAVGPAVSDVSKQFDIYWNSASAYPASDFVGQPMPDGTSNLEAKFGANRADPESIAYLETIRATPLVGALLDRKLALDWVATEVVYDDPAKTLDAANAAPLSPAARAEIDGLLVRLVASGCEFNRNGSWYSAEEAKSHISQKLKYLEDRGMVQTTEQFIETAASASSVSGRPYLVRCGDGAPVQSGEWLRLELKKLRSVTRAKSSP